MAETQDIPAAGGIDSLKARTENLAGRRFGKLTVVSFAGYFGNRVKWTCQCDCGIRKDVYGKYLKNGDSTSCGCLVRQRWLTHGLTNHRIHSIWTGMIQRCTNPNAPHYEDYGGRGIGVCPRWRKFENFYEDTKDGYADNLTLDRPDNDGEYGPSNFRWATKKQQQNNKRNSVKLTIGTVTASIKEWAKISGTVKQTIVTRFYRGYSHEECVYGKRVEKWN